MSDPEELRRILQAVSTGSTDVDSAVAAISAAAPSMDFAQLDLHRPARTGNPEAVYGAGKTPEQVIAILRHFAAARQDGLVTRVSDEMATKVIAALPATEWLPVPRLLLQRSGPPKAARGGVAVVCAGTSDLPVAEEASVTLELLGNQVSRLTDVGVAGIHRVLGRLDELRAARAVVVVAGMEGALASVVAGLVQVPVVAVPTSVGYGAAFGGLAALLGMLNSCAPGVSVVNIDNGYGAAVVASRINQAGLGPAP